MILVTTRQVGEANSWNFSYRLSGFLHIFGLSMESTANQLAAPEAPKRLGWVDLIVLAGIFAFLAGLLKFGQGMWVPFNEAQEQKLDTSEYMIPYYAGRTLLRMWIAFGFSLLFTLVVAYTAAKSKRARFFILPTLDVLQSVPVLSFLSITVTGFIALFPGSLLGVECASIFAIFTGQVWNMAFGFYHSLVTIPDDLREAAKSYGLNPVRRFVKVELPASAYSLIWNSMMSFGGGWFFVAQSEAITVLGQNIQLPGLGSYMANVVQTGNYRGAVLAILAMITLIIASDQLIWRPLLAWADKFKIQLTESSDRPTSWVLNLLRRSYVVSWLSEKVGNTFEDTVFWITSYFRSKPNQNKPPTGEILINAVTHSSLPFISRITLVFVAYLLAIGAALYLSREAFRAVVEVYDHVPITLGLHICFLGFLTFLRVVVMTIVATLIWTPVGVWIGSNPKAAYAFQPIAQILASFPVNMTFPVMVGLFQTCHIPINYGSIILIAMGTQWYILFNVIAGATSIPNDLKEAARTFNMTGWEKWKKLIIPAIFPFWVTGACTAAGGAWNASVVAEVATWKDTTLTADGLGAFINHVTGMSDANHDRLALILCSTGVMSIMVLALNKLIWRRLYELAERRFRLD